MKEKKHILYVCTGLSSFVKKDIAILQTNYVVFVSVFKPSKKIYTPLALIKQAFQLFFLIWKHNIAGFHSFIPLLFAKLIGKKSLIITGGTDCVAFPSISYGNFNKKWLGLFSKWSFRLASHLSPVHESLMINNYTYQDQDYPQQGVLYFIPDLKTPHTTIFNGYDATVWFKKKEKIPRTFITVSAGISMAFTQKLKGIDLILEIAPFFPEAEFFILGVPENYQIECLSSNVKTMPFVPNEQLPEIYSTMSYYLQLSISEGFPNALCEAMLCECVPIVSSVGGMPDIVGDTGFLLRRRDREELKRLIRKALEMEHSGLGIKARKRIEDCFPEQSRKVNLLTLVEKIMV
jgi:glycosyltransferase involved in cell wall biosynthesis